MKEPHVMVHGRTPLHFYFPSLLDSPRALILSCDFTTVVLIGHLQRIRSFPAERVYRRSTKKERSAV
ncbi:hypothetical protein CFRS1_v011298 [Colletotrichum fructicola]|nr:hypothetical protein CFRS1_v011298 [Colletotrichum fructicola]